MSRIFAPDERGLRPVHGHHPRMQQDPHFREHLLFYEYFDGDTGRGVGASHQRAGLIARLLMPRKLRQEVVVPEAEVSRRKTGRRAVEIE